MPRKATIARSARNANDDQVLYHAARAEFVRRGTTLAAWCRLNGIPRQTAEKALLSQRFGRRSMAVRKAILIEVGIAA
jgi:hypothetical protein